MNLLILGGTGGTGRELVRQSLALGHNVTALVRNPLRMKMDHERLTLLTGNVLHYNDVERAVRGKDAVLSTLGHKRWFVPTTILSEGTRNIVKAMTAAGVQRLVCETALGVGDSRGKLGVYYTLFVIPAIIFFYYKDKERQENVIRNSTLDWVIVRPGQLTNGKQRGTYKHGDNIGSRLWTVSISRADVAEFMIRQLTESQYLHSTPGIAY